jgi:hypothetical protein
MKETKRALEEMEKNYKRQTEEQQNPEVQEKRWSSVIKKQVEETLGNVTVNMEEVKCTLHETKQEADKAKDKEARRNNIIIYKAKDSNAGTAEERQEEDYQFCYRLLDEALGITFDEQEVKGIIRLGKRGDAVERPILVEFENRSLKNSEMETLKNLSEAEECYKRRLVCHDMNKKEREQLKQIVTEAKSEQVQEDTGEWIFRVQGNPGDMKIVNLCRRQLKS